MLLKMVLWRNIIADANELAAGNTYEGTLDENGAVPEADAADDAE